MLIRDHTLLILPAGSGLYFVNKFASAALMVRSIVLAALIGGGEHKKFVEVMMNKE